MNRPFDVRRRRPPVAGPRRRAAGWLAGLAALALPVTGTMVPAGPALAEPGEQPAAAVGAGYPGAAPLDGETTQVTLLTGDRVQVDPLAQAGGPGAEAGVSVQLAERPDGSVPEVQVTNLGRPDALYVLPADVQPYLDSGRVDQELFNVVYLAANGYGDEADDHLPVIVEYADQPGPVSLERAAGALAASDVSVTLESIDAAGVRVDKARAAGFWQSLVGDPAAAASETAGAAGDLLADGVEKVWLDAVVQVDLAESVPQIGAPAAWEAGLDGTGTTVAVLDTGIDLDHPDVADQVVGSRSFIAGEEVDDGHGHGTHVASTVAGTGAASDGARTGVAPGAGLVIGKVLSNGGSGPISGVIAGMEWAALEQGVDVVSMSLGSGPTDGTDPASQAVNTLTEQTGALFVIAAGNTSGRAKPYSVSSPGVATAALTVGAVDKSDALAGFSNQGPRRGDHAIKPEVTAPGVDITAAIPGGGYGTSSGTSMATPHVAGAAAVLAQQHPDWDAEALKAALVAGAEDGGFSVYEQGAGRIDLARTIAQPVRVSPATADFGLITEPVTGPVTRELTYTNPTDEPVTLTMAATVRSGAGDPAPDGVVTLDQDTLALPAGGSATLTVTLDAAAVEPDFYTGSVVATGGADAGSRLTSPLGFVLGEQLFPVRVRQMHSDNPLGWHPVGMTVAPIAGEMFPPQAGWIFGPGLTADQWAEGFEFLLPRGTYMVFNGSANWYDPVTGGVQSARLFDPEVTVPGDTEVVLDAADAEQLTVDTHLPSEGHVQDVKFQRWVPEHLAAGGGFLSTRIISPYTNGRGNFWVSPTDPVTTGEFKFSPELTLVAPTLTATLDGSEPVGIHPQYPLWGEPAISAFAGEVTVSEPTVDGEPAGTPPGPLVTADGPVTIGVTVTNTGGPTVSDLAGDSPAGDLTCTEPTLEKAESTTCTVTATAAAGARVVAPITVRGQAAARLVAGTTVAHYLGTDDPGQSPPASDAQIGVSAPTVSGQPAVRVDIPQMEVGGDLAVEVTATNTGETGLTGLSGTSPLGELTCLRPALDPGEETRCTVVDTVADGEHAVPVTLTGQDPDGRPTAAATTAFYQGRPRPAMFAGNQRLPVVDVGTRTPEEIAGLDLDGALAMLNRHPDEYDGRQSSCWPTKPAVDAAVAAGAAGVVLAQNEENLFFDRPGSASDGAVSCGTGELAGGFGSEAVEDAVGQVPVLYLPYQEADLIRERLAAGGAQIALAGTPETPYFYQLNLAEYGAIPDSLQYRFTAQDLAVIEHDLHGRYSGAYGFSVTSWKATDATPIGRPQGNTALPPFPTTAPIQLTEYYGPLDPDTVVRHEVEDYASPVGRQVRYDIFDAPTRTSMVWNDGPPLPAVVPPLAGTAPVGYTGAFPLFVPWEWASCAGCREGDMFFPHLRYTASSDPGQIGHNGATQLGQVVPRNPDVHLYRDGVEIPPTPDPYLGFLLGYELPPEPDQYRLTHRLGNTDTAWELTSQAVPEHLATDAYTCDLAWIEMIRRLPRSDTPCHPEPLIFLRYDLGLDLANQAKAPGRQVITVTPHRQPSQAPMPDIAGLDLWVSYDGGDEWTEAQVSPRGDGQFRAAVIHPPERARGSDRVSLRVEAWDVDGNRIEQVVHDAFTLHEVTQAGNHRLQAG